MSGTSLEVTCSGTDQNFILTDNALAASPADTAVRVHDNGACLHKDVNEVPLSEPVSKSSWLAGTTRKRTLVSNFLSFDNCCSDTQVFNTAIVAGTKECFVNLDSADFFGRNYIIYKIQVLLLPAGSWISQMYTLWRKLHPDHCGIQPSAHGPCSFKIFHGFLICLKDACLCTGLYCHVAERHTIIDA